MSVDKLTLYLDSFRFRSELHGVQQEGVRANVEAVVEDLMLCVEERLWDEDKGRLVTASRELSRARTMIDDLESRVMVRDTSIAALQKEVQDGKQALTVIRPILQRYL